MFTATALSTRRYFPVDPIYVADYTTLRGITTSSLICFVTGYFGTGGVSGDAPGWYIRDDNDTTSADNGGTVIVASNGKRWKRVFRSDWMVNVEWFGAKGTDAVDDLAAFNAAAFFVGTGGNVFVPAGTWNLSGIPATQVTWVLDSKATFTGAGSLSTAGSLTSSRIFQFGNGGTFGKGTKIGSSFAWLEATRASTENNADLIVLSSIGQIGVLGGSRSSDFLTAGSEGCIGVMGWASNNNATQVQSAYAGYFEARRSVGAGITHGIEIDIVNHGSEVAVTPYSGSPVGMTNALWLASGGGVVGAPDASIALGIINNSAKFKTGILFANDALEGADGSSGTGTAIALAKGHVLSWYKAGGALAANIYSFVENVVTGGQEMIFTDSGIDFRNINDAGVQFHINQLANAANRITTTAAVAGGFPRLSAEGTDADIHLILAPKGVGRVWFNYLSTAAAVPANFVASRYIQLADSSGTVYLIPLATAAW